MNNRDLVFLALSAGLLYYVIRNREALAQQLVDIAQSPMNVTAPTYIPENQNLPAFLMMLRFSEGTNSADGYRMLFGGQLFDSYADHPRIKVPLPASLQTLTAKYTTAAGAYQMLASTWDSVRSRLGLPDFSPASQDQGAIELLRRRGALDYINAGDIVSAINAARKEWASLPGAGYGQPERRLSDLLSAYQDAGGVYTTA